MRKNKILLLMTAVMTSVFAGAEHLPSVKFITPSIMRVQWSPIGIAADNTTGVCVYTPEEVRVKCKETDSAIVLRSSELTVSIDKETGALTYSDPHTGDILQAERQQRPREWKYVAQESVTYDETTAHASQTAYGDDASFAMELDAARELDYYFIKGERMEDLVSGYRYLTGSVSLMPRYLFGYTQSKERYGSSEELISIVREYRRRHVPLDMIVQDWSYWPEGWGYLKLDSRYYPDPKALTDTLHSLNARIMISIWPNPQGCPQEEDFRQRGYMLPGSVYNAFSPDARSYYWQWVDSELFSHGFDAWWCDSSEPIDSDWNGDPKQLGKDYGWNSHEQRWLLNKQGLADALGIERSSLYSLYHSRGIYENQRKACDSKRVVNLTRSSYAGQQRYGTIVWNGDTHAGWQSFADQIPAGLNYMATGNPGTPYYEAILKMINLRYSLIPYIYSLAAQQSNGGYSMARMLAFDWSHDAEVLDIKDQYMFGDFLVCPITAPLSESGTRRLRLPSGTRWTDWWTGRQYDGGQWMDMPLTLDRLPLFVRAGAIVTTTAPAEHTDAQTCDTVTVHVYPGADGSFSLYEDAGDGYAYEHGECARITMKWNDKRGRLSIGLREGGFDGMLQRRLFIVKTADGRSCTVHYDGRPITARL